MADGSPLSRSAMQPRKSALAALAAVSLAAATPSYALVGGTVDPNTNMQWAGVVSITPGSGGVYTGALIDPYHVLTAAHVVAGYANNPNGLTINFNAGADLTHQVAANRVYVHPDYGKGNVRGGAHFAWNDDIAVVRLSEPAPAGVPVYSLASGTPGLNGTPVNFTMVAYGGYSDGVSATLLQAANASVKRVGENQVGALFPADDDGNGVPQGVMEVFAFTFDAPGVAGRLPREAGYAGGDSGSPIFIQEAGGWRIAGVAAFNGNPANLPGGSIQYGAIGGGMVIAPYAAWIQQQIASPVPEPETYALLLLGLGLVVAAARRSRRAHSAAASLR